MTRLQEIYPDNKIILREVGLRDGLQLVKTFPSTSAKQRWIREEYAAGVRHFEVGSFLPAKTFPQFVDVRDIIADRRLVARRLRHRAGAERARRQRGAGLRRCRSGDGGVGDRRAQPGQRQPHPRIRDRQRQAAVRTARRQRTQACCQRRGFDGAGLLDRRRRSIRKKCCGSPKNCSRPASTWSRSPTPSAMPGPSMSAN